MVRRTPKAARKFSQRLEPLPLTQSEALELRRIETGLPSHRKFRERLASKGLVTSPIARGCILTPKGRASLAAHKTSLVIVEAPQDERAALTARDRWLAKHAPPFSRAAD